MNHLQTRNYASNTVNRVDYENNVHFDTLKMLQHENKTNYNTLRTIGRGGGNDVKWYGFLHPHGTTYFDPDVNEEIVKGGNIVKIKHEIKKGKNEGKERTFSIDKTKGIVYDIATKQLYNLIVVDPAEHVSTIYGFKHPGGESYYPEDTQDEILTMAPDKDGLIYISYIVSRGKDKGKSHVHAINLREGTVVNKTNNNRYTLVKKTGHKCEDCGLIKDDVDLRVDPGAQMMENMYVPVFLCDDCAEERYLET